jgi:hypothetical protein
VLLIYHTAALTQINARQLRSPHASNATAADWVRNNVLEFTGGMPEVMVGNALVAEVKDRPAACVQ